MRRTLTSLMLVSVFFLPACGSYKEAARANLAIEMSAINYQKNMAKIVEAFIADYRARARAEADRLCDDAIAAEIRVVDGKQVVNPTNYQIIVDNKIRHYQTIEKHVVAMRAKIIEANKDIEHLLKYTAALKEYFDQSTNVAEMLNAGSEAVVTIMDGLIKKK